MEQADVHRMRASWKGTLIGAGVPESRFRRSKDVVIAELQVPAGFRVHDSVAFAGDPGLAVQATRSWGSFLWLIFTGKM